MLCHVACQALQQWHFQWFEWKCSNVDGETCYIRDLASSGYLLHFSSVRNVAVIFTDSESLCNVNCSLGSIKHSNSMLRAIRQDITLLIKMGNGMDTQHIFTFGVSKVFRCFRIISLLMKTIKLPEEQHRCCICDAVTLDWCWLISDGHTEAYGCTDSTCGSCSGRSKYA